jgi:tetrahydromethanopterin S-methyltransferase subunit G
MRIKQMLFIMKKQIEEIGCWTAIKELECNYDQKMGWKIGRDDGVG